MRSMSSISSMVMLRSSAQHISGTAVPLRDAYTVCDHSLKPTRRSQSSPRIIGRLDKSGSVEQA